MHSAKKYPKNTPQYSLQTIFSEFSKKSENKFGTFHQNAVTLYLQIKPPKKACKTY